MAYCTVLTVAEVKGKPSAMSRPTDPLIGRPSPQKSSLLIVKKMKGNLENYLFLSRPFGDFAKGRLHYGSLVRYASKPRLESTLQYDLHYMSMLILTAAGT